MKQHNSIQVNSRGKLKIKISNYHGLVVEREALHLANGIGGRRHVLEDDPSLAFVLERLEGQHIQNLPELREHGVQRLLQFVELDFLVQVVDVDRLIRRNFAAAVVLSHGFSL